eukprot:Nitzschia sp. Nitz4//scaffold211_size37880//27397//28446//NITZ4_007712-RA/size37880-augustus-gene-0.62-mRNA-1//-1//CDS//3329541997//3320//frame0
MKFCKNLQRVADLSNPEWSPYWTDYKRLKKIIKTLTLGVSSDEEPPVKIPKRQEKTFETKSVRTPSSSKPKESRTRSSQQQGDSTSEGASPKSSKTSPDAAGTPSLVSISMSSHSQSPESAQEASRGRRRRLPSNVEAMRNRPGEVTFFKVLHAEFQKAVHFFDKAIVEFQIREERVLEGMVVAKSGTRFHLWTMLAKSVYRLYTDLLLLETFCIMTYCSFSKILKKHDKVTGFETRNAFMSNVVNKANFTNYTTLQQMINRIEELYTEVSNRMVEEGKETLYEDERLFIEMIHQLNQQR